MSSIVAFFLLTFALTAPADPLILHAQERENAGELGAAAALLSEWLASNPGASGSPEVFAGYFRVEHDLAALMEVSRQFLVSAKGVPGAAPQFSRIARLFDLAGRIEEARNAYRAAYAEGAPESELFSAFLLSFQMNDADSMSEILQKLGGNGGSADPFLRALADMKTGDRSAARAVLIGVSEQTGNPELALKALWILYNADVASGDPAAAALSRSRLRGRFASAPETAIVAEPAAGAARAGRAVVIEMPTPVLLDADMSRSITTTTTTPDPAQVTPPPTVASTTDAAPAVPAPPPAQSAAPAVPAVPAAAASAGLSVQAGSFLMRENAEDLLSELSKRGFAPVVVHETVQGKDRYRVLAGTGLDAEAARAVLKQLSDQGFRGFVVSDR